VEQIIHYNRLLTVAMFKAIRGVVDRVADVVQNAKAGVVIHSLRTSADNAIKKIQTVGCVDNSLVCVSVREIATNESVVVCCHCIRCRACISQTKRTADKSVVRAVDQIYRLIACAGVFPLTIFP
jgi:hypothetical protein